MSIIERAVGLLDQRVQHDALYPGSAAEPPAAARAAASAPYREAKESAKRAELDQARHVIDPERLRAQGMVTPDGGRTPIAEEFRIIKRPLIEHAFGGAGGRHANLIMVTSALPGEGKTFCALNLAISMAMELDHTVLLVDADVARPSLLDRLGLASEIGLLDLLHDSALDVADAMLRTSIDSFSILPAGQAYRHATELLASQAMTHLLNDIASRYPERLIIFDSPPLLLTTESRVLASQMGQIVLVVEAGTTSQAAVKGALRQLEGCASVSLLFNKSKAFIGGNEYGNY